MFSMLVKSCESFKFIDEVCDLLIDVFFVKDFLTVGF
jgi:hypothetical protein